MQTLIPLLAALALAATTLAATVTLIGLLLPIPTILVATVSITIILLTLPITRAAVGTWRAMSAGVHVVFKSHVVLGPHRLRGMPFFPQNGLILKKLNPSRMRRMEAPTSPRAPTSQHPNTLTS